MWSALLALTMVALAHAKVAPHLNMTNLPHQRLDLKFDGMTCTMCERVMTVVQKQIGDEVDLKEEGLKLAIKVSFDFEKF